MPETVVPKHPRNMKFTVKNCLNCGKEFTTMAPWTKHCGYRCSGAYMRALQKARRAKERERAISGALCTVCKSYEGSMAVLAPGGKKGVCTSCMGLVEAVKFDKAMAYRLGYVIDTYFSQRKASRQGRA